MTQPINYKYVVCMRIVSDQTPRTHDARAFGIESEICSMRRGFCTLVLFIVVSLCVRLSVCPSVRLSPFFSKSAVALGFKRGYVMRQDA